MDSKYIIFKNVIDVVLAYILLLLFYLPMLVISLLIKITDGGPVIFKQKRVGKNGKIFVCYKFRTMSSDAPSNLSTKEFVNSAEYITPLGSFLRRTSLDELPQLFNVLACEMSLVGPRPLIAEEIEVHKLRIEHGVYKLKPGITGLSQVCGRDNLTDERKVECDVIYKNNVSLIVDMYIILTTIKRVLFKEEIKEEKGTIA